MAATAPEADQLAGILSTVTDGIVVVDAGGTVLYANASARHLLGGRALAGRNLGIPLAPAGAHQDIQLVHGGKVGWAELRCAPIEWAGRPAIVGSFRDVSARKAAEEALRHLNAELEGRVRARTAELEATNLELEAFAYTVSHDLSAPLRAIGGFGRILADHAGGQLDARGHGYLNQIIDAARRMGELIDGLLQLAHTSRAELVRQPVDLSELARAILAEFAVAEPARRVRCVIEDGLRARGDPRLLAALMRNLLGNAWKYTGKTAAAEIAFLAQDGRLCVADNGAGFAMAQAGQLFQPFRRLHRQDEFPGLGIGLATVRRIVQRHGGEITATGEPGHGARFCFTLPDADEAAPPVSGGVG